MTDTNTVVVTLPDNFQITQGSIVVITNVSSNPPKPSIESSPSSSQKNSTDWTITLDCNRNGSESTAQGFLQATGGENFEYPAALAMASNTRSPNELNFYFDVTLTITNDNGGQIVSQLYLAQGHYDTSNNWWMGGTNISNVPGGNALFCVIENNTLADILTLNSSNDSSFVISPDTSTSKGVDVFAFVGKENSSIVFSKPVDTASFSAQEFPFAWIGPNPQSQSGEVEIYANQVSGSYGKFAWEAFVGQTTVASEYWSINPTTGSMETDTGGPYQMTAQTSIFNKGEWALSYGFYDAGLGYPSMYNQDQSWVYLTPDVSNWMGKLTQEIPEIANASFHTFVLPGAHDAGTYDIDIIAKMSMKNLIKILETAFPIVFADIKLFSRILLMGLKHSGKVGQETAQKIIQNLAVTQVNNVTTMLQMGVRYFDFRPGYCIPSITKVNPQLNGIYHQHTIIPFAPFENFMEEIFTWLLGNPSEIVVVNTNFQGFEDVSMQPDQNTLQEIVLQARQTAQAQNIGIGSPSNLADSYNSLISRNTRLIILSQTYQDNQESGTPNIYYAPKYDSYSHSAYGTTDVSNILSALESMTEQGQENYTYTVLQLQGTSTDIKTVDVGTITDDSWSGSPLMMTKANFDNQTYPWVLENVRKNLGSNQLIVLLNDFCDNALATIAMAIMKGDYK